MEEVHPSGTVTAYTYDARGLLVEVRREELVRENDDPIPYPEPDPTRKTTGKLEPIFECWTTEADGTYTTGWWYENEGGSLVSAVVTETGKPLSRIAGAYIGYSALSSACLSGVVTAPAAPACALVGGVVGDQAAKYAWDPLIEPALIEETSGCFILSPTCIGSEGIQRVDRFFRFGGR